MNNIKLYTKREAAKITGLHGATIYAYAKAGKIESKRTPTGKYLYDISSLITEKEIKQEKIERKVCYCRVSTHGQRINLDNQISYITKINHELVYDIGSGINFKRPGLKKIIDYAIKNELTELVVAYKDRLCRIGYELIEYILLTYSKTNIIIDHNKEESLQEEIANDILQIINVYSAKINGMRSYLQNNDKKG